LLGCLRELVSKLLSLGCEIRRFPSPALPKIFALARYPYASVRVFIARWIANSKIAENAAVAAHVGGQNLLEPGEIYDENR
jgi:hypothetical protein